MMIRMNEGEYFRNEKLNANNFFNNLRGQRRQTDRYNQFGGKLGLIAAIVLGMGRVEFGQGIANAGRHPRRQ